MARRLTGPRGRIAVAVLLILIGIAPIASVALAGLIAEVNGCDLHEGYAQPCIILGFDAGGILYTMVVLGWLMLVSILFLAGGLLVLATEAVLWLVRRWFG